MENDGVVNLQNMRNDVVNRHEMRNDVVNLMENDDAANLQ